MGRRLTALCQVGRMVQRSEGQASGGLDVALGPNVGATPMSALGPAMVLQYLVAGGICSSPALSAAALPLVCSPGLYWAGVKIAHKMGPHDCNMGLIQIWSPPEWLGAPLHLSSHLPIAMQLPNCSNQSIAVFILE